VALGTLVDSNVLLDVLTEDDRWLEWSSSAIASAAEAGPLFINPIIYAEVSVRFSRLEDLEEALLPSDYRRLPLPWESAFLAAKVFLDYRRNKGTKSSTLPDFFIGAHAAVAELALLSRDTARYRTYFPTVRLIAPDPTDEGDPTN
jgi:predicted nucleic acid-binding protein